MEKSCTYSKCIAVHANAVVWSGDDSGRVDWYCRARCYVFRTQTAVQAPDATQVSADRNSWIHFDFELIFGHCTFRNLLLLPNLLQPSQSIM